MFRLDVWVIRTKWERARELFHSESLSWSEDVSLGFGATFTLQIPRKTNVIRLCEKLSEVASVATHCEEVNCFGLKPIQRKVGK